MQPAYELPQVRTTTSRAPEIEADLVAVPIPQDQQSSFDWLDKAAGGELSAAVAARRIRRQAVSAAGAAHC